MDVCRETICKLTNSKHVMFTRRGNKAIDYAVKFAKEQGYSKLLIPHDGGWLHYPKVAEKYKLELCHVDTVDALLSLDDLRTKVDSTTIVLYHSHGGYFAKNDVPEIFKISKEKNAFVIIDCSGAVGLEYVDEKYSVLCNANYADFVVSSLRKNKPVNADGGFVATNLDINFIGDFFIDFDLLLQRLQILPHRINFLVDTANKITDELKVDYEVISGVDSLVVVVAFSDLKTKENIIKYCDTHNLEYEICPREIRVLRDAISIEVKRLKEEES
ncbi:DegT/DnrJ/EryC1/StrS family aminotransferase [Candidatus Woesearchaeota archaeon]|nr:DegT/DnrJ/EryC1/StrS family aminotransferase [Candidatus Woesearchaeota archaeon]